MSKKHKGGPAPVPKGNQSQSDPHKLESEKLIISEWIVKDDRKRKYYKITDKGRKELVTEKQAWLEVHNTLMRLWDLPEAKISIT